MPAGKSKSVPKRVPIELVERVQELKDQHPRMSDPEIIRKIFSAVLNDKHQMIGQIMKDIRGKLFSIFENQKDVEQLMNCFLELSPILNDIMSTSDADEKREKINTLQDEMSDVRENYFEKHGG